MVANTFCTTAAWLKVAWVAGKWIPKGASSVLFTTLLLMDVEFAGNTFMVPTMVVGWT